MYFATENLSSSADIQSNDSGRASKTSCFRVNKKNSDEGTEKIEAAQTSLRKAKNLIEEAEKTNQLLERTIQGPKTVNKKTAMQIKKRLEDLIEEAKKIEHGAKRRIKKEKRVRQKKSKTDKQEKPRKEQNVSDRRLYDEGKDIIIMNK